MLMHGLAWFQGLGFKGLRLSALSSGNGGF